LPYTDRGRVFTPNGCYSLLQDKPLQFLHRQIEEEVNSAREEGQRTPKGGKSSLWRSFDSRGILHAPVSQDRLTGKDRAGFLRVVTDGDDEVPSFLIEAFESARRMPRPTKARFCEYLDCQRIDSGRGLGARTVGFESAQSLPIEYCLSDLAPGRVPGAEEQHS
jgi:hypothetical protein